MATTTTTPNTEASGLNSTEALAAVATTTTTSTTTSSTTSEATTMAPTTTTDLGAAPTATDETGSESTVRTLTPAVTDTTSTAPTATTTAETPASPIVTLTSPPPESVASVSSPVRAPPATPARPATAVRSTPQPIVLDSPTQAQQMALQLLQSGLMEEPRRSRALAALLALPDARHLEFRALDPNDPPNLGRMQNMEAAVGFTAGEIVVPGCSDCAAGHGQFAGCVRVEGWLHGSCTNCHFGGEGSRCSLRAVPILSAPVLATVTGSPTGRVGLRARRPAAPAVSCAAEAQLEAGPRGRKRTRSPPRDPRPVRRRRLPASPPPTVTAAHLRAAIRAGVAPTTGLVRAPRGPFDYRVALDDAVARFRVASPSSRERLRLEHSLAGVAMQIVASSEANPGLFLEEDEDEEDEEDEEEEDEEEGGEA
ncbi:hypothetical protein VF21_01470 [Pseudogymnoascus sp. 05NY08]|nr:hypothetical protein VF21_01470 [Pseudogymnoascus sp. 05NY08]